MLSSSIRDKIVKTNVVEEGRLKMLCWREFTLLFFPKESSGTMFGLDSFLYMLVAEQIIVSEEVHESSAIDACLWLIFFCAQSETLSNEWWNCFFFKNSILGVLLSVLENFCRRFSRPDRPPMGLRGCFWGKRTNKGAITKKEANRAGDWEWKGAAPFSSPQTLVNWSLYLKGNTHDVTLLKLFYMHGLKPKN